MPEFSSAGYGISNAAATGVQTEVSRISQGMSLIHKLLSEQDELTSMLEQRLHSVLRPTQPQETANGNGPKDPTPVTSPISDDLRVFAGRLEFLGARYRDILDRLEV